MKLIKTKHILLSSGIISISVALYINNQSETLGTGIPWNILIPLGIVDYVGFFGYIILDMQDKY